MIRFIAQSVLTLLGNAVGLLAAVLLLDGFEINWFGLLVSIVFFTIAQIILAPFILKLAIKHMPAFRGGIALVTTFVVLVLTTLLTSGLSLNGITTWLIAPLIIWFVTVISGVLLPMVIFKKTMTNVKSNSSNNSNINIS